MSKLNTRKRLLENMKSISSIEKEYKAVLSLLLISATSCTDERNSTDSQTGKIVEVSGSIVITHL